MKQKLISCMLAIMIMLTSCEKVQEPKESRSRAAEFAGITDGLVDMEKTLDIIWYGFNVVGILPAETSEIQETLEELFNIRITNVQIDLSIPEQSNVMMATGFNFDINSLGHGFSKYAELGLIRPVEEAMFRTYMPNIVNPTEEAIGNNWVDYGSVDGVLYGVPNVILGNVAGMTIALRDDYLDAVGYDKNNPPKTLDELETLLLKIVTEDPDGNGKDDTHALNKFNDFQFTVLGAFGISNRYWYADENGNPMHYAIDPKYKEALKVLQRWYTNGIFDPEIITDGRNETTSKFINGRVAGYDGSDWAFTHTDAISPLAKAKAEGIDITVTKIPPVSAGDNQGGVALWGPGISTSGLMFGKNSTDEKIVRLMQMTNAIFSNEDFYKYLRHGPEGVSYDALEGGFVQFKPERTNKQMAELGIQRFIDWNCMPTNDILKWNLAQDRYEHYMEILEYPKIQPHAATVFETEADKRFGASAAKIVDEFFWKTLTSEWDIDEKWNDYKSRWLASGGQEILDAKLVVWKNME